MTMKLRRSWPQEAISIVEQHYNRHAHIILRRLSEAGHPMSWRKLMEIRAYVRQVQDAPTLKPEQAAELMDKTQDEAIRSALRAMADSRTLCVPALLLFSRNG